ncbi:hypothetical protein B0H16DRAFT_1715932 [Mycena metata]|uniref:Uncharacterized protein n=1 Tax=Mycena metata TaxID=1033252 RepID=A0AAD7NPF3_9AGAR|nr:hypothetical protein B0H16DRAFT_1715932 [Mycena metata]
MPRSTRARGTRSAPYNFSLALQAHAAPLTADRCVALAAAFGVTEAEVVFEAWRLSGVPGVTLGWGDGWGTPAPSTGDTWGTGGGWVVEGSAPPNPALTSIWEGTGATSGGWGDAAWAAHEAVMESPAAPSMTGETTATSS